MGKAPNLFGFIKVDFRGKKVREKRQDSDEEARSKITIRSRLVDEVSVPTGGAEQRKVSTLLIQYKK